MPKKKVQSPKEAVDAATVKKAAEARKKAKEAAAAKKAEQEAKAAEEAAAKEAAAIEAAKVPQRVVVRPRVAPAKIGPVDKMQSLLKEYEGLCTKPAFSKDDRGVLINKLSNIIQFAIRNAETKAVLDELYGFFIKERRGMLAEEVVFQGIAKLGNNTRMQMEVFYSAMMVCVSNKTAKNKTTIDLDRVRGILKSEKVVAFFASKASR